MPKNDKFGRKFEMPEYLKWHKLLKIAKNYNNSQNCKKTPKVSKIAKNT